MSGYGSFLDETREETNAGASAWLSAAQGSNSPSAAAPPYQRSVSSAGAESLHAEIVDRLEALNAHNGNISNLNSRLGTKSDTNKLRKKLSKEIDKGTRSIKQVAQLIGSLPRADERRKKFQQHLEEITVHTKELIQESAQKKRSNLAVSKEEQKRMKKKRTFMTNPEKLSQEDRQQLLQQQQQEQEVVQLDNEIAYNEGLIREREAEVLDIEANVHDINTIFKELHHLVHSQGDSLNRIEDNVITTAVNVNKGNKNLEKSEKHDKRGRFLICLILLVVLGIALAVVTFFVIAFAFKLL